MANPQKEDGHIDIANEVAEVLMRVNLSAYEYRVLWCILRKTYGWNKKTDRIAGSQFVTCTGLDRRLVHRAIKALEAKRIIVIYRDDKGKASYGFQKNWELWPLSSNKMTPSSNKMTEKKQVADSVTEPPDVVICRDDKKEEGLSSVEMTKVSSKKMHTNTTTNTKRNNPPIIPPSGGIPDWVPRETFLEFLELRKKLRKPLLEKSYPRFFKTLRNICDDTRASPEEVLNNSIVNGWQGIFPPKKYGGNNGNGTNRQFGYGRAQGPGPEIDRGILETSERLRRKYESPGNASEVDS